MTLDIIVGVNHFKIQSDETLIIDLEVSTLSNDHVQKEKDFYNDHVIDMVGKMGVEGVFKSFDFGYKKYELHASESHSKQSINKLVTEELKRNVYFLERFTNFFWFLKDNSVSISSSMAYCKDLPLLVCYNRSYNNYNSSGQFSTTRFTAEEIRMVANFFNAYFDNVSSKIDQEYDDLTIPVDGDIVYYTNRMTHKKYSVFNRIERALVFLATARGQSFLPYRISMFMPIYESLFSSDATEVTQKICERAAFYLYDDTQSRRQLFEMLKKAYDVRSRFFHGQKYTGKLLNADLLELSVSLEDTTRLLLRKVILEDYSFFLEYKGCRTEKDVNDFLSSLIFSNSSDRLVKPKI